MRSLAAVMKLPSEHHVNQSTIRYNTGSLCDSKASSEPHVSVPHRQELDKAVIHAFNDAQRMVHDLLVFILEIADIHTSTSVGSVPRRKEEASLASVL